jgi:hypothetical protein
MQKEEMSCSFKRLIPVYLNYHVNPNPHCFIAQPCGGRGKRGAISPALKICLIKTLATLKLSSEAY